MSADNRGGQCRQIEGKPVAVKQTILDISRNVIGIGRTVESRAIVPSRICRVQGDRLPCVIVSNAYGGTRRWCDVAFTGRRANISS
ncbi:MAG: hypothetical protein ACKPKP_13670 [Dolichospermum sp.]